MSYWQDLGFLERGLQAGAIPGDSALESLMQLDAQRQEARRARRQADAEASIGALDFLQSQSLSAAGTPTTAQDVMRLTQANSMFDQGNAQGALDTLFLPQDSGFPGNQGQSRIAPTLRPEDIRDMQELLAAGDTPDMIMSDLQKLYGPKTFTRLLPDIREVLGL